MYFRVFFIKCRFSNSSLSVLYSKIKYVWINCIKKENFFFLLFLPTDDRKNNNKSQFKRIIDRIWFHSLLKFFQFRFVQFLDSFLGKTVQYVQTFFCTWLSKYPVPSEKCKWIPYKFATFFYQQTRSFGGY